MSLLVIALGVESTSRAPTRQTIKRMQQSRQAFSDRSCSSATALPRRCGCRHGDLIVTESGPPGVDLGWRQPDGNIRMQEIGNGSRDESPCCGNARRFLSGVWSLDGRAVV
jgi:hypothetical protein